MSKPVQSHSHPACQPARALLHGPIPLDWLQHAAKLPGKSLHVAVALWFQAGLLRARIVPLSNRLGREFGLDRNAKYRALSWLEAAGLVVVQRKLGRTPTITIREPERKP